jgi:hypothetical protein
VFITLAVFFTLKSGAKNTFRLNVLLRVIINHIQMMAIAVSFQLSWPSSIESMLGSMVPVADIGTRFISIDCFIDLRNEDGTGENALPLVYIRLIIFCALPAALVLVSVIFWYIHYFIGARKLSSDNITELYELRNLAQDRDSRITTTNVVVLFLVHPSVVKGLFDMFL